MIRYLQFPYHFNSDRMQQEALSVAAAWKLHFNLAHYEGNWSGIALRAPGGNQDNLLAEDISSGAGFEDTLLMQQCPYIREVLGHFKCEQNAVRLLKLEKGAVVKEHRDVGLAFEAGEARLHIPVITHPDVAFYLDNHQLEMKAGDCWYINANLPHRLSNPSPVDRIHLVIDCVVNDWLRNECARTDLPVKSIKDTSDEDHKWQQLVIDEMRRSNDPQRMAMADEMERAMNAVQ